MLASVKINAFVTMISKDRKGNFSRINDAVGVAHDKNNGDYGYFHIKDKGRIHSNKRYVMMISSDSINRTIITVNHSYVDS
ncbi:putative pectinesterase/pectinesterase inhibitor 7 [Cardamine amara subsp. amara]|uniref:Pectinesterase/pectinesterase inhibitor 7 n=1 Tax=Cardamine amara subsp. amara TaxID=228776 RepID=A0ABD1A023_CARAN